ncbi:2-amino-4-hydroxy-6-hydroxymethyldihydropteridine diphosphokinase [bacterium]|nr:2-amino-4-hydroxy-6-hydroxymethyldihydropteridine diphosphokinase [bacterium]
MRSFLGLGSNTGDREYYLNLAFKSLKEQAGILSIRSSSIYETSPWGLKDQPWFLNQVLEIKTEYPPGMLLDIILKIEQQSNRQRQKKWGPRTLDIDILLYGDLRMHDEKLVIPHPYLSYRRFMLMPLKEIAPDVWVPGFGMTVQELFNQCEDKEEITIYSNKC